MRHILNSISVYLWTVELGLYGHCAVLQHAVVDLNTINVQDENATHSSADSSLNDNDKSSEDTVQLPLSRVLLATTEPRAVKTSKGPRKENVPARATVTSSSTLKRQKRKLSTSRVGRPRSKRLKDQHEMTEAVWTESLFVSEQSEGDRDMAEDLSTVDSKELVRVSSSTGCSSAVTTSAVTCTSSVAEDERVENASLHENQKKSLQQNFVTSTEVTSSKITAANSSHSDALTLPAASGQTLLSRNGTWHNATTVNITGESWSYSITSMDTAVQTVKTTLSSLPNSETRSYPSCTSKTTFSFPVHTNTASSRGMISATSVQVRPANDVNKMLPADDGQIVSSKPSSITSAELQQQQCCISTSSAVYHVPPQSQNLSFQSPPSQSLVRSVLPPICKSVTRPIVQPHNTRVIVVPAEKLIPQSSVPQLSSTGKPENTAACFVRQPCSSVPISTALRCSTSGSAIQQQTLLPVTGVVTESRCAPRAVPARLSPPSQQPVRIRVSGLELSNRADPTAVMSQVRGILSRTNTLPPGAQIRIHYVPPSTTSSQSQTCTTPQTTARVPQLDGTANSDDETTDVAMSENTGPAGVLGISGVRTSHSRRRSKVAAADETQPTSESHVR